MPWSNAPRVDFDDEPQYRWPSWRVDHRLEDLFGELHEQFNTVPMFIQDADAFHHDVAELAGNAQSKAEFLTKLQERRDQRLEELRAFHRKLACWMVLGYTRLNDDQIKLYFALSRNASFDSLIAFCASLLGPNRRGDEPSLDEFERCISSPPRPSSPTTPTTTVSPLADTQNLDQDGRKDENAVVPEPVAVANRKRKRSRVHENEIPWTKRRRLGSPLRQPVGDDSSGTPLPEIMSKTAQQTGDNSPVPPRSPRQKIPRAHSKAHAAPTSQHSRSEPTVAKNRRAAQSQKGSIRSPRENKVITRRSKRLAGKLLETDT